MEDIDETVLNYAEVKAIATGNPLIKRKMELDLEMQRLTILESQYKENRYRLEDDILKRLPQKIAGLNERIAGFERDVTLRDNNTTEEFHMQIGKRSFSERKDAGELLLQSIQSNKYTDKVIGKYRGFEIVPQQRMSLMDQPSIALVGARTHIVEMSDNSLGCIARIENHINGMEKSLESMRHELIDAQNQMDASKKQLQQPFEQEREILAVMSELATINAALNLDKSEEVGEVLSEYEGGGKDILEMEDESEENEAEY